MPSLQSQGINNPLNADLLQKHKLRFEFAQSHKGEEYPSTKHLRAELPQLFKVRGHHWTEGSIFSFPLSPAYAPCTTPLEHLTKVMVDNVKLETHHRGQYILLRTLTPTDFRVVVGAVTEDEAGNVIMLQLHNQETEVFARGGLSEGTVLVVVEPYLHIPGISPCALRVDHPSDQRVLSDWDIMVPVQWRRQLVGPELGAMQWKAKGNDAFNAGGYRRAIDCYTQALSSSPTPDEALTIKLNRALTFLRSHQFDAALRDLEPLPQSSEKALLRKAQALYHLQRFAESCEVHRVLEKAFPGNSLAQSEFARAKARLAEQQTGVFPFKEMQREATRRSPSLLDRATYVGPVAVRPTQSSGLGLFTTTAVKAGDLLVCEKAFACAHMDLYDFRKSLKLLKNPSLIPGIVTLHHEEYESVDVREVDNTPVVDSFLLDRIITANAFFTDRSSRREETLQAWGSDGRIPAKKADVVACGLWPLISRINHSCHSTAECAFIGDMRIVRAARDLPADTEVTCMYRSVHSIGDSFDRELDSTPALKFGNWGFRCTCILCHDHETTPADNLSRRRKLLQELGIVLAILKDGVPDPMKLEEHVINKIVSTYVRPAAEVPRLALEKGYPLLALLWARRNNPGKAIECAVKGFEALGYVVEGALPPYPSGGGGGGRPPRVKKWKVVTEGLVGCWMTLAHSYRKVAPALAPQAQEFAKVTYRIVVGEDETFGETFAWRADLPDGFLSPER
ncbi:TPR domain protein [Aspergillus indologenus CBS 114.80]|uniref:TPR domain protein n=1 Tax=Aspergillus indologenus CBS 114.80 TaxID=1450541 RepID=A0A2V5IMW4_9EURO|nr:TPR domain protein [Aspergillus indologenus CBS 114.80]